MGFIAIGLLCILGIILIIQGVSASQPHRFVVASGTTRLRKIDRDTAEIIRLTITGAGAIQFIAIAAALFNPAALSTIMASSLLIAAFGILYTRRILQTIAT